MASSFGCFFFFFFVPLLLGHSAFAARFGGGGRRRLLPAATEVAGVCASLVVPSGYKCEEFDVTTQDGYILRLQRIPAGRDGGGAPTAGRRRRPVLLQHGVLADGVTWLLNSPDEALAYVLADAGFDVWIANTEELDGAAATRPSTLLSGQSMEQAFWAWSWDELVAYDLPATVDFVYQRTGQKLDYVGHSLGTLTAMASFSEGRLVDKLRSAALLSPIAFLSHMTTTLGILAARSFLGEIYTWLGIAEFDPTGVAVRYLMKKLCQNPTLNCYDLMTAFTGMNCCLNESTVELYLEYEPQSTSTKNMVHLAQTFRDGALTKFDYGGGEANMRRYGRRSPPAYNLSNIPGELPIFLSYGGRDRLSNTDDFVADFAHADFVMGTTARRVVYDAVVAFFRRQL
ncbi:unnamed protein product [Spirodela intermedia]|uniref:Lipase n=1 Tax=Spirodela intermedia TaxID=51605 RepID=A0A7I8JE14_SPIIN|nr:unnamed protein product [Spirodela intermedia]CAA6668398.1 unnamed protein product [Spirodela intermedia]